MKDARRTGLGDQPGAEMVNVGRIDGLYGVRGWVKVFSYTEPRENILTYSPWYLNRDGEWQPYPLGAGRRQGKGVVAHVTGFDDRDAASALIGRDIAVRRDQMLTPPAGEYYWSDLIGLEVVTREGIALGQVVRLLETGANDVLVVRDRERERLIPYVAGVVVAGVDLEANRIEVDWDPDWDSG